MPRDRSTHLEGPGPGVRLQLLNAARLISPEPFTLETPAAPWAFALSIHLGPLPRHAEGDEVVVDLEVARGAAGIGPIAAKEKRFVVERHVADQDRRVSLSFRVTREQPATRLVIRNADPLGRPTVVVLHGVEVRPASAPAPVPVVHASSGLLDRFPLFDGISVGGFTCNWIGVRTRIAVWQLPPEEEAAYASDRREPQAYPLADEHVLDWIPLLEAVSTARGEFRMVAVGAGWGRWLTAGAFAARRLALPFHVTGVEAEPQHFAWMIEHCDDNDVAEGSRTLIHAAASGTPGWRWFPVGRPGWYGQTVLPEYLHSSDAGSSELEVDGQRFHRVAALTVRDLLGRDAAVDYLHMDIQGTEHEFLATDPELLDRAVRIVNIGTHDEAIERRLRALFAGLGWQPRYDVPMGSEADVALDGRVVSRVRFGDGVQVWWNPKLPARSLRT
jgi:FkbM family methyltransferase